MSWVRWGDWLRDVCVCVQEAPYHDAANDVCYLILLWQAHTQQSALAHHLCCHILMIARAIARTLASSYAYLCPPPANAVPQRGKLFGKDKQKETAWKMQRENMPMASKWCIWHILPNETYLRRRPKVETNSCCEWRCKASWWCEWHFIREIFTQVYEKSSAPLDVMWLCFGHFHESTQKSSVPWCFKIAVKRCGSEVLTLMHSTALDTFQ